MARSNDVAGRERVDEVPEVEAWLAAFEGTPPAAETAELEPEVFVGDEAREDWGVLLLLSKEGGKQGLLLLICLACCKPFLLVVTPASLEVIVPGNMALNSV